MTPILEAAIGRFTYPGAPRPALAEIELTVARGEFVVITGPAGAGKTTLCHCLTGVIPKAVHGDVDGWVRVADQQLSALPLPRVAGLLGWVGQSPDNQLFNVTVAEDVAFGPENLCRPPDEVRRRVQDSLAFTNATALTGRFSHLLSGGQSQRVVLASVLALGPDLFVLDQPAGELDPSARRLVYENIHRLNREAGKTIILVEDRLSDVVAYASRVILLAEGRVLRNQPPRAFFTGPDRGQFASGQFSVRVPDAIQLAEALRSAGVALDGSPLTVDEVVTSVRSVVGDRLALAVDLDGGDSSEPLEAAPPLVQIQGLSYRYPAGVEALSAVDFTVGRGEFVAIVGENGAGKSTLARHLIGLLRPTAGVVRVAGDDLARLPVHRIVSVKNPPP